jgi:hypothetical protein
LREALRLHLPHSRRAGTAVGTSATGSSPGVDLPEPDEQPAAIISDRAISGQATAFIPANRLPAAAP